MGETIVVDDSCSNCRYWTRNPFGSTDGECSGIMGELGLEITSFGNGGGYVECINTKEDFGCRIFEESE